MSSANSAIALADGQQAKTHGLGHVVVHLGTKEFEMHVVVTEVEDEGILGMDFLSRVDSRIDIVKNQLSINGEVFDCCDFKNQPLSSRCMVRRSTLIEPYTEVLRSATLDPKASQLGMRLLEQLPRVDNSLSALSGSRWFSPLDLASGYLQVAMATSTKEKTAFVTSSGLYEWNVMPFGLCNASSTFARLMELVLKGLHRSSWHPCLKKSWSDLPMQD